MRSLKIFFVLICATLITAASGPQNSRGNNGPLFERNPPAAVANRYNLDASQSKFIAHALAGGLLWFKGHNHLVAVREFTGEAQLTPGSIAPASLVINARTASMVETSSVFTEPQKQIINRELREIVLLPDQYPEIVFKSTSVIGKVTGADQYDLRIMGDLTLHGVTRPITIPTKVTLQEKTFARRENSASIEAILRSKQPRPYMD
jgi:polyisoprenoid-binding protein YceI